MSQPEGRPHPGIVDQWITEAYCSELDRELAQCDFDRRHYEALAHDCRDRLRRFALLYGFQDQGARVLLGDDFYVAAECAAPHSLQIGHFTRKETRL